MTSRNEGGPGVVTEALACTTPVLCTRIPAAEGLLGSDYPGLFPVGDEVELARLLARIEGEPAFLETLRSRCLDLRASVSPEREARALAELLAALAPPS